jgi:hypothetical protein
MVSLSISPLSYNSMVISFEFVMMVFTTALLLSLMALGTVVLFSLLVFQE